MASASPSIDYASIITQVDSKQSNNVIKPTIFDVIAQENMNSLFKAAFNHFFKWLTNQIRHLSRFQKYSDEIYLAIHSAIEFAYLKGYDALFSEHFYGMRRHNLNSNMKRILSLLFSIVLPYLRSKLDDFYEEIERQFSEQPQNDQFKTRIKNLFLKIYPYIQSITSLISWYYRFKFMMNLSDFHSPLLSILNLNLVYNLERYDLKFIDLWKISPAKAMLNYSNYLFTSGLYFIQFLKWYQDYNNNQSYGNASSIHQIPAELFKNKKTGDDETQVMTPPQLPDKLKNSKHFNFISQNNLCPICNKSRTNECVLTVSGFVFCYPCIFKFIKEFKRCPLTNFPCTTKNIIRLYTSSN